MLSSQSNGYNRRRSTCVAALLGAGAFALSSVVGCASQQKGAATANTEGGAVAAPAAPSVAAEKTVSLAVPVPVPAEAKAEPRAAFKRSVRSDTANAPVAAGAELAKGKAQAQEVMAFAPARAQSSAYAGAVAGRAVAVAPMAAAAPPAAVQNANLYVASTYQGGSGERERMEKLIREGVMVEGKRVRLEAFTREYKQDFAIPTSSALALSADMERAKLITDGGRTYLQVGLQAIKGEAPRRPPLNVAVVMDVSGSMEDENKMEDARRAAHELVKRLRPDDTFSLIAFDDTARVVVPAGRARNKKALHAQIDALHTGSGTNIYDGLKLGYREAAKGAEREGGVSLVVLLSDGQVNAGVSDPEEFRRLVSENADKHDVQTTTVGMGMDFNETLMLSLAQEGKGNYHFLKNGADAPKVFAREMDDLAQIVAKAVKVRIALAPGVGFVRVLGARALSQTETQRVKAEEKKIDTRVYEELGITQNRQHDEDGPGIKMLIPNFRRGDSHVILVEVEVPKGAPRDARRIADVHLKYKDLSRPANRVATANASVSFTADRAESVASIKKGVKKNLLGFQTGEALMKAADLMAQGQAAQAVRVVDERMVVLGVAAREWGDRDLDKDGRLLDRYKVVLTQVAQQPQLAQADLGNYLQKSLTYNGYQMTR